MQQVSCDHPLSLFDLLLGLDLKPHDVGTFIDGIYIPFFHSMLELKAIK